MNYYMIRTDDMLNGDGLRVVVFLAFCQHRCPGCHNPETWDGAGSMELGDEELKQIYSELEKDYISGITLSGGDPLFVSNLDDVYALISAIKEKRPDKTIWLYTGFTWNQIFCPEGTASSGNEHDILELRKDIVKKCDVLVDGKFVKSLADVNCPWVGSTNQLVIDVQETLKKGEIVLYD